MLSKVGGHLYRPWTIDTPTSTIISSMILSGDQAYFMGLFFFLAGYVTAPSLKRKGPKEFIKDRFIRLIIPVILYELVIFPFLYCFVEGTWYGPQREYTASVQEVWDYYFSNYIFVNSHIWFCVTLFAFSLTCALVLELVPSWKEFSVSQNPIGTVSKKKYFNNAR
jgi:glucan biosynthesis protein C